MVLEIIAKLIGYLLNGEAAEDDAEQNQVPELWPCSSWRGRAREKQPWRSHSQRTPAPYSHDKSSIKEISEARTTPTTAQTRDNKPENCNPLENRDQQNKKSKDINPRSTARNASHRRPKPAPRDRPPKPLAG